jgi:signal transduction histidine kinase
MIVDEVLRELESLAVTMDSIIEAAHTSASTKLYRTMVAIALLSVLIVGVAILLNVSQYRSVMGPLNRLREAAHRIAAGDFQHVAAATGDAEFAGLARDFNRMAAELDGLYRELEEKVRDQSKELVRSERLASVGFLAAGVAHELNNPLNIISGYAELSLKQLRNSPNGSGQDGALKRHLEIMVEEAFRCKRIIEQLLSLVRVEPKEHQRLPVEALFRDLSTMIAGLKAFSDRKVELDTSASSGLCIRASEAEMKQVMLNLAINALEAVEPVTGRVNIAARGEGHWVQICVRDNGRGMTPEVLDRVFEPFFTQRHGGDRRGVGLGLAITHAIVEAHGGRIRAESDGPGRGSRFIVELPAAEETLKREPATA